MKTLTLILLLLPVFMYGQNIIDNSAMSADITTGANVCADGLNNILLDLKGDNEPVPFTLYPVNQIRHAKALPLDGIGFFGIRYNSKILGISERYSQIGSFVYYKIMDGESIRAAMMYRINVIVLTDTGQIFYYNFNNQRRGWGRAHGKKYLRFKKQFKK